MLGILSVAVPHLMRFGFQLYYELLIHKSNENNVKALVQKMNDVVPAPSSLNADNRLKYAQIVDSCMLLLGSSKRSEIDQQGNQLILR